MAGQGQLKQHAGSPKFFCRLRIAAPGAREPYSLWCNVERPEEGVAIVKLVMAQGVELAVGWVVEIDGKDYEGVELRPGGKLLCRVVA